jgi:hypothetical protein
VGEGEPGVNDQATQGLRKQVQSTTHQVH